MSNFCCVKREKHSKQKFLYISPPSIYGASPSVFPPMSLWLSAWLSPLFPSPAPLTLFPALSRTPEISWGRGNRHHGLSCHPSSCTWPLLSPRAPLLQRTTCQTERTDRGQVGEIAQEKEKRIRLINKWLEGLDNMITQD